jgi:uncharacterized membrane protein YadS
MSPASDVSEVGFKAAKSHISDLGGMLFLTWLQERMQRNRRLAPFIACGASIFLAVLIVEMPNAR